MDINIAALANFASRLGEDGPFQRILARSQETGMEEAEGFFYFPIPEDLVAEFVPEAVRPDIELTLTMFTESAPFHRHMNSDGVLFIKHVDDQDPRGWRWGINHRWHPMECHVDNVIFIPREMIHGLLNGGGGVLYAVTANYPPLEDGDIEYVKDAWER